MNQLLAFFAGLPAGLYAVLAVLLLLLLVWLVYSLLRIRRLEGRLTRTQKLARTHEAAHISELQRSNELLAVQISERERLNDRLELARRERHDFRHQIVVLQEFVHTGDRKALADSLSELSSVFQDEPLTLCENPVVDSLAKHYFSSAEKNGIALDVAMDVTRDMWVSALDLGVIFGNLLENAVVAAAEAPEGKRFIRVRTRCDKDALVLTIGNTFGSQRRRQDDQFLSTKENHAGVGLISVETTAEKYGGCAEFCIEGELFRSSVILFRPEPEGTE